MPTTWQHHGTRLLDFIPFTLVIPIITPLYILIDTTGPKLYGLMLDGVPDAGRMFGERWKTHFLWHPPGLEASSMITWGWSWGLSSSTCTTFACSRAASRLFGHSAFQCPNAPHSLQCVRLMRPKSSSLAPLLPPLRPPREANLCHQTLTARNLLTFACHWSFVAPPGMTPARL